MTQKQLICLIDEHRALTFGLLQTYAVLNGIPV